VAYAEWFGGDAGDDHSDGEPMTARDPVIATALAAGEAMPVATMLPSPVATAVLNHSDRCVL